MDKEKGIPEGEARDAFRMLSLVPLLPLQQREPCRGARCEGREGEPGFWQSASAVPGAHLGLGGLLNYRDWSLGEGRCAVILLPRERVYAGRESGSQGFGGIPSFIGQTQENKGGSWEGARKPENRGVQGMKGQQCPPVQRVEYQQDGEGCHH